MTGILTAEIIGPLRFLGTAHQAAQVFKQMMESGLTDCEVYELRKYLGLPTSDEEFKPPEYTPIAFASAETTIVDKLCAFKLTLPSAPTPPASAESTAA